MAELNNDFIIEDGILTGYSGSGGCVRIPEGVTAIAARVFYGNSSVTELILPSGLSRIEESAFFGCSKMTAIRFSSGPEIIENHAFAGCSSLTDLVIPEGVKRIEQSAFSPCASLVSVSFPESLEYIGEFAFSCCRALSSVSFSDSLEKIDRSAFSMCSRLKEISLPKGLKSISRGVFLGCAMLKKLIIGSNVSSVQNSAFSGCLRLMNIEVDPANPFLKDIDGVLYSRDGKCLMYFPGGRLEIAIPDGVTRIGDEAFYENRNFDRISLPGELTSIGSCAFYGCTELLSIEFPGGLKEIGQSAFERCSRITSLGIPDGIKSIGDSAFRSCKALMWLRLPEGFAFDLHWFCAPNDPPCYSADHTIIPYVSTRAFSDISSEIGKRRASLGLIMSENAGIKPDAYTSASYIDYIRSNTESFYDGMLESDDILHWMLDHRLVLEEDVEGLLERASSTGRAAACALLLDYRNRQHVTIESTPAVSLDDRFDALENALDF